MAAVPKVGFVSLGCPKALVDSEGIVTRLRAEGYAISPSYDGADLVVVNTCGFIESAMQESLDAIGEALEENGRVIVTGCLGAKGDVVRRTHPKVLAVTGPHALEQVMTAVHEHLPKPHEPFADLVPPQGIKLTPRHYAYLKISEGCNHRCTFCIIPSLRGDLASRPIGEVMREAENLVKGGVKELLVISQDTSAYGVDLKYGTGFWGGRPLKARMGDLATALGNWACGCGSTTCIPIRRWTRSSAYGGWENPPLHRRSVSACEPADPEADETSCERRGQSRAHPRLAQNLSDITIRSTFIAGFPGETEDEFRELLDFLEEAELDRVGCFSYSPVPGAKANEFPGALPDEVREERRGRLMRLQEKISARRLKRRLGKTIKVLVDESKAGRAVGRSAADAPEIDGVVHIEDGAKLKPGDWAQVKVTRSDAHDLWSELDVQQRGRQRSTYGTA